MMPLLPGLVSVTFRQLSPQEVVGLLAEAQLAGVEWGGDIHVPHGDLERAREVGDMTRDAGLAVAAYGSYYAVGSSEASETGKASEAKHLHFETVLETALALGAPLVRVWAGGTGPEQTDTACREHIADESQRIAALAAEAKVGVAYEFHGGTLTETTESALDLLRAAPHPNVGTLWQTPVGMDDASCLASLTSILPRLRNLHVFHWSVGTSGGAGGARERNGPVERRPLAEGAERWRMLFRLLRQTKRSHYALLEFVAADAPESFRRDARTLRELIEASESE